jgi:hypothetical protein
MSREFRFRAWHEGATDTLGRQVFPAQMLYDSWNGECLLFAKQGQPVHIMQYTGLKDSQEHDIYEGDIVAGHWNSQVVFEDGKFKLKDTEDDLAELSFNITVIGNIYSNPELLAEVK